MINELQRLGFTENESKVYSALLDLGLINAGEIIKKTGLHRNIIYDNLEKLIKKGLVSFVVIKGIKHFETSNPKELRDYIEKQKQEALEKEIILNDVLPIIELKRKSILKPAEASIFKGKLGLKNVFEQLTSPKNELLIFATGWGMKAIMGVYYKQWHLKLKQNKVEGRAVLSIKMKTEERFPYKIRYISEEMILPSTILIYGSKVITVIWEEEPLLIVIDNQKVSQSYKAYFETIWNIGKK